MKKLSKVISILMAAVIALSAFAVSSSAVATELTAGNTKETATNIPSFGTEYVSTLSKAGEQDWFKFTTLSEDAYYTFSLENYNIYESDWNDVYSVNLFVYDTYNKQIVHIYGKFRNTANIKLEANTTYYIKVCMGSKVTSSTGNYEILINYKLDPVSDVKEEATTINVNTLYKYSLDGTGDADWYKFTAPVDGTYKISLENYNIYESDWNDIYSLNLFVYDTYNKQVAHAYGISHNSVNTELGKNATYYVKVLMGNDCKSSTGNYGFSINCESVPSSKSLSKITIDSLPTKTTYKIGESFDKTGLAVTAHYSDGSKAAITSCTVFGFDSSTTGTKELTISYTENGVTKTATFDVSITEDGTTPTPDTGFDFMAILSAIWEFFVSIFNFIIGLFA